MNRKPAVCYGDSMAKYYQDGRYYDGSGRLLEDLGGGNFRLADPKQTVDERVSEPVGNEGPPNAAELALRSENQQLRDQLAAERAKHTGGGKVPVGTAPMAPPPGAPVAEETSTTNLSDEQTREILNGMQFAKLKKRFLEAGGPAEMVKGKGAKDGMIDWLMQQPADSGE